MDGNKECNEKDVTPNDTLWLIVQEHVYMNMIIVLIFVLSCTIASFYTTCVLPHNATFLFFANYILPYPLDTAINKFLYLYPNKTDGDTNLLKKIKNVNCNKYFQCGLIETDIDFIFPSYDHGLI